MDENNMSTTADDTAVVADDAAVVADEVVVDADAEAAVASETDGE